MFSCLLFTWATAGWPPFSHIGGIALLPVMLSASMPLSPLAVAALATIILSVVALWETISLGQKRHA